MSSLEKMLGLLDVFSVERPVWSSEELIAHAGVPASTLYRYLKVLHRGGYVSRVANKSYVLGPRVMELDRISRETDPVHVAGSPIAQRLTAETGHSTLLCILFSDSVMCVQQTPGKDVPAFLFSRGQRRPLVAGASAKSILAWLPMHQLRVVHARHDFAIAGVGLGGDWEEFKARLKHIRQQGYAMTAGEYNPGIISIGAPLFNAAGEVLGSLALAADARRNPPDRFERWAPRVMEAAAEVSAKIASNQAFIALPARALG